MSSSHDEERMPVGYLLCGVLLGAIAAMVSLLMGFSVWSAIGVYGLAGGLGVGLTAAVAVLRRSRPAPQNTSTSAVSFQERQNA